jgi:gluconokinase
VGGSGSKVFDDFGGGLEYSLYVAHRSQPKFNCGAMFAPFLSRQEHTFAEKMLSAMVEAQRAKDQLQYDCNRLVALAIVLTGVSGSGKSEVGQEVAKRLGVKFLDADDFHSAANKDKMHRGIALTDDDRRTWLENLHDALRQEQESGTSCVLACSALKRVYREQLRDGLEGVRFFYLKIDYEVVARRLELRTDHFFDKRLLDSQFAILEEPQPGEAFVIDQNRPLTEVVQEVLHHIASLGLKPT